VLRFANAGHPVPYVRGVDGDVRELRARGMPLGLLPGMDYDEAEAVLAPGERILLHSDGVAEAHGEGRAMFGFNRLAELVGSDTDPRRLIDTVLAALNAFTVPGAEQEDDITLVSVARAEHHDHTDGNRWVLDERLADFEIASHPGNERLAIDRVTDALADLQLDAATLDRLGTAVGEATMNAIEHGNRNDPDLPVRIEVNAGGDQVMVRVTDRGGGPSETTPEEPDLDAKLKGLQSPRGWGLFLIRNMVDSLQVMTTDDVHAVEFVVLTPKGDGDAQDS